MGGNNSKEEPSFDTGMDILSLKNNNMNSLIDI